MAVTERVTVLMDPAQKAALTRRAKAEGVSASEYLRLAAEKFEPAGGEELELERLSQVLEQIAGMYRETSRKIDETEKFIAESNKRIASLGAER